jgi:hypothetical protein
MIKPENSTSTGASRIILYHWDDDSSFLGEDEPAKNLF